MGKKSNKEKKQQLLKEHKEKKAKLNQLKLEKKQQEKEKLKQEGRIRREQQDEKLRIEYEEKLKIQEQKREERLKSIDNSLNDVIEMNKNSVNYYLSNLLSTHDYSTEMSYDKIKSMQKSLSLLSYLKLDDLDNNDDMVITLDLKVENYKDTIANELCEIQLHNRISIDQMIEQLGVHNTLIILVNDNIECTKNIYYNNLRNGYKLMPIDYCIIEPISQSKQLYQYYYIMADKIAKMTYSNLNITNPQNELKILELTVTIHKFHYLLNLLEHCNLPVDPIKDILKFRGSNISSVVSLEMLKAFRKARSEEVLNKFEIYAIQNEILDQASNVLKGTIYVDRINNIKLKIDLSSCNSSTCNDKRVNQVITQGISSSAIGSLNPNQCELLTSYLGDNQIKVIDNRVKKNKSGYVNFDVDIKIKHPNGTILNDYKYYPFNASFLFNLNEITMIIVVDEKLDVLDTITFYSDNYNKMYNKCVKYTVVSKNNLEATLQNIAIFLDSGFYHRQYELMYQMFNKRYLYGRDRQRITYDMSLFHNTLDIISSIFKHYKWRLGSDGNNYNLNQKYNLPEPLTIPLCSFEFRYQMFEQFMISRLHNFDENKPKLVNIGHFGFGGSDDRYMRLDLILDVTKFKEEYSQVLCNCCHCIKNGVKMYVNEEFTLETDSLSSKNINWDISINTEIKGEERNRYWYVT